MADQRPEEFTMFRIKLPSGEESIYSSAEDFTLAVQSGSVTPDAAIFHAKAERWVPVSSHPTYHRAVAATRPATRTIQAPPARPAAPSASAVTAPTPALTNTRPSPSVPAPEPTGELELLLPDPMLGSVKSAHRVTPPPAPAISVVPPATRLPFVARAAQAAPAIPSAPATPSRRGDDLVFVETRAPESNSTPPAASLRVSAPRPAVMTEPPPVIEMSAPVLVQPEEAAPPADAPSGFMAHDQMLAFDPVAAPEPLVRSEFEPRPERASHPVATIEAPRAARAAAEPERESWPAVEPLRAQKKSSGNSPRLLLIAAVVVLMVAGVGLVAWRSGGSKSAEAQPTPTTTQVAAAPAPTPAAPQETAPAPAQASPLTKPMTSQPVAPAPVKSPGTSAPAAAAAQPSAPAPDSAPAIIPGRPQSLAMDIDVSGAAVGQESDAQSSGTAIALATVTDHYSEGAAAAASQLAAQMNQIGFSKVLAPVRFTSVEGMEGARHTISSAAGMLASYRSRMQALEKAYGDSAAQSERNQKPSPRDLLGWEHRLPNRETAEAAQVVDLSLTQVDSLFAALLQHPEVVQVSGETVTITDAGLNQQYKALKQWLGQKVDVWSDAPATTVPPTVQQMLNAFVKGAAR
jgi:hypothetical protein